MSGNVGPGCLLRVGGPCVSCAPSPRPQACLLLLPFLRFSWGHLCWENRNSLRTVCPAAPPTHSQQATHGSSEASTLEAGPKPQTRAGSQGWSGGQGRGEGPGHTLHFLAGCALLRDTGPRARDLEAWGGLHACCQGQAGPRGLRGGHCCPERSVVTAPAWLLQSRKEPPGAWMSAEPLSPGAPGGVAPGQPAGRCRAARGLRRGVQRAALAVAPLRGVGSRVSWAPLGVRGAALVGR